MKNWALFVFFTMLLGCGATDTNTVISENKSVTEQKTEEVNKPSENSQQLGQSQDKIDIEEEDIPKIPKEPVLLSGDVVRIDVSEEPELCGEFNIAGDGIVSYPLLGQIKLQGKTVLKLEKELTKQLSQYLMNPIVNVYVVRWKERKVYVLGAPQGASEIVLPVNEVMTASRLLLRIGVTPENVDIRKIFLVRKDSQGNVERFRVPFESLIKKYDIEYDIPLEPGDLIRLEQNQTVFVLGSVSKPGAYRFDPEVPLTLWDLVLKANGPSSDADLRNVTLVRQLENGQKKSETVTATPDNEFLLQANDVAIVSTKTSGNFTVTVLGEVKKPGTVSIPGKVKLSTVIALSGGMGDFASDEIRVFRSLENGETKKIVVDYNEIINTGTSDIEIFPGDVIHVDESFLF